MDVWLIPVGPVVAKVSATVFGPGLELRRAIAERALARLVAAFGPADAVWPTGSPTAPGTPSGSPYSDLESAATPDAGRAASRAARLRWESNPGWPGEVTAVGCTRDGAVVVYRLFTDARAATPAFAVARGRGTGARRHGGARVARVRSGTR